MQQGSPTLIFDPRPLKRRHDLHMARKIWHALGVLTLAIIYTWISHQQALRAIAAAAFFMVAFDFLRQKFARLNRFALKFFGFIMREHERESWAGTTYLILGVFILVWVFPRPVVLLTLLFLALADPIASYFGIRYGRDKLIGSKSLQGTFAAFATCSLIAGFYLYFNGILTERLLIVSLIAGLGGALSELIPLGKLDDNLTFPVVNATFLWGLFFAFGGLS
ncbi:MAG: hypothetical protein K1X29_05115 [Bdellovibrionales bacterium]|nr:hypothetical protein [Bdellovibrionales bacterium]